MAFGSIHVQFQRAGDARWTLVTTPHLVVAIAPDEPPAKALPAGVRADVLVLTRRSGPEAIDPSGLASAGVQLVLAPHPCLPLFVAREVTADGSIVIPPGTEPGAPPGFAGAPTVRADGVTVEVRVPD